MGEHPLTGSSIQRWWPVWIGILFIVFSSGASFWSLNNQETRLEKIENLITPDQIQTQVARRVNMQRDIDDLKADIARMQVRCDAMKPPGKIGG